MIFTQTQLTTMSHWCMRDCESRCRCITLYEAEIWQQSSGLHLVYIADISCSVLHSLPSQHAKLSISKRDPESMNAHYDNHLNHTVQLLMITQDAFCDSQQKACNSWQSRLHLTQLKGGKNNCASFPQMSFDYSRLRTHALSLSCLSTQTFVYTI